MLDATESILIPAGGMKLPPQQPALQQLRQPLGIGQVGLPARHVLHVPGVAHQYLPEVTILKQRMVDRHRVDPGRLHRHMGDAHRDQPPGRLGEHPVEGLERPLDRDPAIQPVTGQPDCHRDHVLAHVNRCAPLVKNLHACLPEPAESHAHAPRGTPQETKTLIHALAAQPGDTRKQGAPAPVLSTASHSQGIPASAGHMRAAILTPRERPRPAASGHQVLSRTHAAVSPPSPSSPAWITARAPGSRLPAAAGRR